jgi:hypothetical protein
LFLIWNWSGRFFFRFPSAGQKTSEIEKYDLREEEGGVSMVWNYGVDLAWGHPIPPNATDRASVAAKPKTFIIIRDDFEYEREQKVGIASYNDTCATLSPLGEGLVGVQYRKQ